MKKLAEETRDKRVYEALVASPQSSLRKLAADTGINRGSVYESIKTGRAGARGLYRGRQTTSLHGQQPRCHHRAPAGTPGTGHRGASAGREDIIRQLPKPAAQTAGAAAFATFYEDHKGVAAILRDVLATCREQDVPAYRVISTKRVRQYMYHNFSNFTQRRIAEGISVRVIGIGTGMSQDELSERKELPATRGEAPNRYTLIYGNKTALITMSDTNVLSAIVIDNPGVTHMQKELFDHLWGTLD